MTTRTYGFALPLKYDDVKPGMLISAMYGTRHIIGLAFSDEREMLVAVFDDGGESDPRPPYVIDLSDVHTTLTQIVGEREFDPADNYSFDLLPQRKSFVEGFFITGDGRVGLAVTYNRFGTKKYVQLDFDTGEGIVHGGVLAVLPPARLYVVQPGREQRREVVAKQGD
ncbi:hypothetical protein [uncultured Brevundimonas sp.]|uniref:hypothetical protein n=1 Tax=uncultured Brevundimonas sp. TaxID=213418 RepID=UPI0025E14044|nr:hypothetical protein [uncultured Brevundimonas sp.]